MQMSRRDGQGRTPATPAILGQRTCILSRHACWIAVPHNVKVTGSAPTDLQDEEKA